MTLSTVAASDAVHLYNCDRRLQPYHPRLPAVERRFALRVRCGDCQAAGGDVLTALTWARRIAADQGLRLTVTRGVAEQLAAHGIQTEEA